MHIRNILLLFEACEPPSAPWRLPWLRAPPVPPRIPQVVHFSLASGSGRTKARTRYPRAPPSHCVDIDWRPCLLLWTLKNKTSSINLSYVPWFWQIVSLICCSNDELESISDIITLFELVNPIHSPQSNVLAIWRRPIWIFVFPRHVKPEQIRHCHMMISMFPRTMYITFHLVLSEKGWHAHVWRQQNSVWSLRFSWTPLNPSSICYTIELWICRQGN